jgi:CheY-like chemotaxis protein
MEVKTAECGEDALDLVGADRWMPHIALIDMMMPGMSGIDLLKALRAREDTAAVPILFVTASARSTEVKRYTDAGAIGVISKPFDPVTLASLVRRHYEERPMLSAG